MLGSDTQWSKRLDGFQKRMILEGWGKPFVDGTVSLLQRLIDQSCRNVDRLLTELNHSVGDRQQFVDHFLEGWAADLFFANNFPVVYEPHGRKGPDLRVDDSFNVEVTRKRENAAERANVETGELVDIPDLRAIISATLQNKLDQAIAGEANILLLRSSRGFVTYQQAKSAFDQFLSGGSKGSRKISAMVFDDGWTPARKLKGYELPTFGSSPWSTRIHVDPNPNCEVPLPQDLLARLRSLTPPECDHLVQEILAPSRRLG